MKCTICNYESLNLNAKFCTQCGNKLFHEIYFCKKCGNKIIKKVNFCSECGEQLIYSYTDNDSKKYKCTEEKKEEETEDEEKNIIKEGNRGELNDMENNIIKEKCLEIIPCRALIEIQEKNIMLEVVEQKDIIPKVINEKNTMPEVITQNNMLLPVIEKSKELALIEIKNEIDILKENKNLLGVLRFAKATAKILGKIIRALFMTSAGIIGFIGVSILVVVSTAIITKNIVNSYYGITPEVDTTYSIFQMKDDVIHSTMKKQEE